MLRTLTEIQKAATTLITLGMALVALFGPTGTDAIQILSMLTVTAGVLLMLLSDHARRIPQGRLGGARVAARRLPVLAAGPARSDGRARRVGGAATLLGVVSWRFEPVIAIASPSTSSSSPSSPSSKRSVGVATCRRSWPPAIRGWHRRWSASSTGCGICH